MSTVSGSCLCGSIRFQCENTFSQFHLCHCSQCQKFTGSAHVSNLFTAVDNITWLSGESLIQRFTLPGRLLTKAFCSQCGSPTPYVSGSGKGLVVPAGSLDDTPHLLPQDRIFWAERSAWYDESQLTPRYKKFPE